MTEITILTAGDIHISDENPRARIDNYKEAILGKLDQLRILASKLKADAVMLTGDLYNLKKPTNNSHALNRELISLFSSFRCPVYIIPGNHDLTANDLDTLHRQPISVLFASGALKNLSHEKIIKKDLKVSLEGIPFTQDLNLASLEITPREGFDAQVCLMHLYTGPESGNVFKERLYGYKELAVLSPDIYVLGHYHIDQGIQWQDDKCFINLGSISRGTLHEDRIEHEPKFGIIKITKENDKVKIIAESKNIKIQPPEEVFDLEKKE